MKKILILSMLILSSTTFYARINDRILLMKPMDRHTLSIAMQEVADAYETNNRMAKAREYNRVALEVYPIGDQAHRLANKLNIVLNDAQTFTNFIEAGDKAYETKEYKKALRHYLMAYELENPMFLYQKFSQTYEALNDPINASYYQGLMKGKETSKMMDGSDVIQSQPVEGVELPPST